MHIGTVYTALALTAALFSNQAAAGPLPFTDIYSIPASGSAAGLWSYGTTGTSPTGMFSAFTQQNTAFGGFNYASPTGDASWGIGQVDATTYNTGSATLDPYTLSLNPGQAGGYAVARFTSQYAGTYQVSASFWGEDFRAGTTSDVHILANGVQLYASSVNGYQDFQSGSFSVFLQKGQTLDFAVGNGGSAASAGFSDFTAVGGTITSFAAPVPEPETYAMLGVGLLAVGAVARRRKGAEPKC